MREGEVRERDEVGIVWRPSAEDIGVVVSDLSARAQRERRPEPRPPLPRSAPVPLAVQPGTRRGRRGPASRFSDDDIRAIRRRYAAGGITMAALAREYRVTDSMISVIVRGVGRYGEVA